MKTNQKLYISDIAYTLGDAHSLNELKSDSKRDEIDFLLGAGLDKFRKSQKSTEELAYEAAARTLVKSDREPGEIDALVFSTTITLYYYWSFISLSSSSRLYVVSLHSPSHREHLLASRGTPTAGISKPSHSLIPITSSGTHAIPSTPISG